MTTRLLSALTLVAGLAVAGPAGAQAQGRGWGQPQYGGYGIEGVAYDNGYRDGLSVGDRDVRRGDRYDVNDSREYRDGDRGYDRRYGSKGEYKRLYRQGFEQGYRDAFYGRNGRGGRAVPRDPDYGRHPDSRRYPDDGRYPNSGRYPDYGRYPNGGYGSYSPAYDKGFSDGYEKGLDDGRDGDRFDPTRQKWYREGDRGFNGRYGSKDAYKNAYRDAFRQGYEQGYRDARGGYGGRYPNRTGGLRWPF